MPALLQPAPDAHLEEAAYPLRALGAFVARLWPEMTANLEEDALNPHFEGMALLMADPKPEEDDLEIPSFLDRRKPEAKPDRKAAMTTADASLARTHLAPKSK